MNSSIDNVLSIASYLRSKSSPSLRLARRAAVARRKSLWGLGEPHEPQRRRTSRHESSN
jgi:hypothetical protein